MELFGKTEAVKLRSHHDKYLVADDDLETVRQSRNGSTQKSRWTVEMVEGKSHVVRLKSCHGRYLTATDVPFLLGMTGKKVLQADPTAALDCKVEWEPIRDGVQVKLRSWCGKLLRANGGTPPWRDSITHDEPHRSATQRWVFWDVEGVEVLESDSLTDYLSTMSSFSSVSDELLSSISDDFMGSQPGSPVSTVKTRRIFKSARLAIMWTHSPKISAQKPQLQLVPYDPDKRLRTGMEVFQIAKTVRLRSHHDKYLHAAADEESVTQDRDGSTKTARWTVELVPGGGSSSVIRLKSCYGRYLTASNQALLMTGRKVFQTLPARLDSSVEWEPIREGSRVKLKTRYGNFLRANGGLPPWRNSVSHDVPNRTITQDWILWDVDVVEIQAQSPGSIAPAAPDSDPVEYKTSWCSSPSIKSPSFTRQESHDSWQLKCNGRIIYYHIGDEDGEEETEGKWLIFKGNDVEELTRRLEEVTGLRDIIVCSRSPLNGELFPLRLQLPPHTTTMHVVLVQSSSPHSDASSTMDSPFLFPTHL